VLSLTLKAADVRGVARLPGVLPLEAAEACVMLLFCGAEFSCATRHLDGLYSSRLSLLPVLVPGLDCFWGGAHHGPADPGGIAACRPMSQVSQDAIAGT